MRRFIAFGGLALIAAGLLAGEVTDEQRRIFEAQTLQPCDPESVPPRVAFVSDACVNRDFEAGLDQWSGAYGNVAYGTDEPDLRCLHAGLFPGNENGPLAQNTSRHTVVLAADGPDPIAGIALVASGARAVRIGNTAIGGGVDLLERTFVVRPDRPVLGFRYAAVLQDPHHVPEHQPLFRVRVTDANGAELAGVVDLDPGPARTGALVADANNPFFTTPDKDIVYRDWTCALLDLRDHIGETVTVQFIVEDCSRLGHWGYAYVDEFCDTGCVPAEHCGFGVNLVQNGDFESGNTGIGSAFTYEPAPAAPGAVLPGEYAVVQEAEAATISPAWLVRNHETCDSTGKFLVVNGDTGEDGMRLAWSQQIAVTPETAYRFCAYFRNLSQCPLDVKPKIELRFISPPDPAGQVVIDTAFSDACDWDRISRRIFVPAGVVSLTAEIWLDESAVGDGNDLAIDDISLRTDLPEVP